MKTVSVGEKVMVFDWRLWEANGGDSKTDSFMRPAIVLKTYREKAKTKFLLADVQFLHRPDKISAGHFVSMIDPI